MRLGERGSRVSEVVDCRPHIYDVERAIRERQIFGESDDPLHVAKPVMIREYWRTVSDLVPFKRHRVSDHVPASVETELSSQDSGKAAHIENVS